MITLATLNARYLHSSLALRYLLANLGPLQGRARLREFTIHERPADVVEKILADDPTIVALGVYIWNAQQTLALARTLKAIAPDVVVVIGGPEVSYETESQPLAALADYVIRGEGDVAFAELASALLSGARPAARIIDAAPPELATLELPYALYDDEDIAQRVIYVEASRGCPFRCEFCLSALDARVRAFDATRFLAAMQRLLDRGARHFKFIDRTFNLAADSAARILRFFRERLVAGMLLHFELIPDRLPPSLRDEICRFPAGALQFEVGVQSFDDEVNRRISRRQSQRRLADNIAFLRDCGVYLHTDLIAGLPGEGLASFGAGFDKLHALRPAEIQVGVLKRLRGAPIARHSAAFGMTYACDPPYEVLETAELSFAELQQLKRFARYWDLVANSGNFSELMPLLCGGPSAFEAFWQLSAWLYAQVGQTHGIALDRLAVLLARYLEGERGHDAAQVAALFDQAYRRTKRSLPRQIKAQLAEPAPSTSSRPQSHDRAGSLPRQRRWVPD